MKVLVTQSCLALCDLMDCSLQGSSVHGILQARILELIAVLSPGDFPDQESNLGLPHCRQILYHLRMIALSLCNPVNISILLDNIVTLYSM